jgi:hypothetical protein
MLYRVQLAMSSIQLTTLVVIDTDCIGSRKSNYHSITTTTAPLWGGGGGRGYICLYDHVVEYEDRQFKPNLIKTFWCYDLSEDNIVKR